MLAARREQIGRRRNHNIGGNQTPPNPAILNKQILDLGRQQNWNEILLFYKQERKHFNNVNFATTMSQLGRIRNVNRMDQLFISFLDDLANQLEERGLEAMGVRQIANIVHAIGKMHLKNACTRRIIMYVARPDNANWLVTTAAKESGTQSVASIAWAFAKLGIKSSGFFSELEMNHSKWLVKEGNPQAIANTVWAYATLDIESPRILAEVDRHAEKIVNEGYPQAVANTAWACAKLGTESPNLFSAIDNRAEWLIREGNPQAVANIVWACATLGIVLPKLFDEVENNSAKIVANGAPQAITNIAWACGRLGVKIPRFFAEIDKHAQRIVKEGNAIDIANTAWASATLGINVPKLFSQVERHSTWFVKESDSQAVSNTVWALATLGVESPKLFAVVDRRIPWLFGGCRTAQEVSNIVWAFGKFGIASQRVFSETEKRSEWIFDDDTPQSIANIASTFAVTGYPAPDFFDALQANIETITSCDDLQGVANICYALVILDLGKKYPSALTSLWNLAISMEYDQAQFTPEALMQLVQVKLYAEADGIKLQEPPAELKKLMDNIETYEIQSKYQKEVSEVLSDIGFAHEEEVSPLSDTGTGGILAIDMACRKQKVAIEYDGPSHFLRSPATGEVTSIKNGPTKAKRRFLEKLGWKVINIDYKDWMEAKRNSESKEWLRSQLEDADVNIEEKDLFAIFEVENLSANEPSIGEPGSQMKEEEPKATRVVSSKPDAVFAVSSSFTVSPFFAAQTANANDNHPWRGLSESTLKRKTVPQLSEYLQERGRSVVDSNGKKLRKADLIAAVQSFETMAESMEKDDPRVTQKSEDATQSTGDDPKTLEEPGITGDGFTQEVNNPWGALSESTLKRKTVVQLSDYLQERGITVADDKGKKLKKADLIVAVLNLSPNDSDNIETGTDTVLSASKHAVDNSNLLTPPSEGNPWNELTDSSLKRKTVAQLTEYLMDRGAKVTDENGKTLKKAYLISAVKSL